MSVVKEGNKLVNGGGLTRAPPRMLLLKLRKDNFGKQFISLITCSKTAAILIDSQFV